MFEESDVVLCAQIESSHLLDAPSANYCILKNESTGPGELIVCKKIRITETDAECTGGGYLSACVCACWRLRTCVWELIFYASFNPKLD